MSGTGSSHSDPGVIEILDGDNYRWVGGDPQLAADRGGALGEHPGVVPRIRLADVPFESAGLELGDALDADLFADQPEQRPRFQMVVPGIQASHPGGLAHPVPVLAYCGRHDGPALGRSEAPVASHDLEAGR